MEPGRGRMDPIIVRVHAPPTLNGTPLLESVGNWVLVPTDSSEGFSVSGNLLRFRLGLIWSNTVSIRTNLNIIYLLRGIACMMVRITSTVGDLTFGSKSQKNFW